MITATRKKFIKSLRQKRYRDQHKVFVAEGDKIVREIIDGELHIDMVCGLPAWIGQMQQHIPRNVPCFTVTQKELEQISSLKTPNQALAVVRQPAYPLPEQFGSNDLVVILDGIQDPGNLGTIIRAADWFGVRYIFCSPGTADVYNPKVIQATMGSFMRLRIFYTGLEALLERIRESLHVYAALLGGKNMFDTPISLPAALLIGNESKGLSSGIASMAHQTLSIPSYRYGDSQKGGESLNAAMATGIMLSWFRHEQIGS